MGKQMLSRRREEWWQGARLIVAMVCVMWILEVIDSLDSHKLDSDGIVPRNISHLYGILLAPFLHAGFGHLIANTIPFLVLGFTVALISAKRVLAVTAIVVAISGIGTWLTASSGSTTVGASGVVFGYATYVIGRGVLDRRIGEMFLGIVVAVMFGGALLWGLIPHSGISWQAHLFGGVGGLLAAQMFSVRRGSSQSHTDRPLVT